jgi:D-3-phosphoglycerate dehydrogenase
LALVRNIVGWHRDIAAGRWHYTTAGPIKRASELTLGHRRARPHRQAHGARLARNVFKRVIAADPYLIDGDFPGLRRRAAASTRSSRSPTSSRCIRRSTPRRGG